MIDVTFTVDVADGERELHLLAASLDDINATLRIYADRWLKRRVSDRFRTREGWPERAEATQKRVQATETERGEKSVSLMRSKLTRDLRKARKRLARVEGPEGFERERARQNVLAAKGKRARSMPDVIKGRMAAIERRELVLKEFERLAAGGDATKSLLTTRQTEKLAARIGRAKAEAGEAPLLGRIAESFQLKIAGGRLEYGSTIPWAGVHNEGGTAGKGARIPARPFAYLTNEDVDTLVEMLREGGSIVMGA